MKENIYQKLTMFYVTKIKNIKINTTAKFNILSFNIFLDNIQFY